MTGKHAIVFSIVAMALVLSGCSSHKAPEGDSIDKSNVIVLDPAMQGWVFPKYMWTSQIRIVQEPRTEVTSDGRLKVWVEILNKTNKPLELQIKTVFKDADGNSLQDETNWSTYTIARKDTLLYNVTALNKDAKGYAVRIKRAGK
jgi:uncharacterized protein YcfL